MPRFRLSLRWMMLVVLVVALLLFGEQLRRTRQHRLAKADEYRAEESEWRRVLPQLKRQLAKGRDANPRFAGLSDIELKRELDSIRDVHDNHRIWAEYSQSLARRYEQGASRPWAPLGNEPTIPREIDGSGK